MLLKEGTTTDAYQHFSISPHGQRSNIQIKNTGDTHPATFKIVGYITKDDEDSGEAFFAEQDLNSKEVKRVDVVRVFEEVKISIKTKGTPNHTTFEIHAAISKVGV